MSDDLVAFLRARLDEDEQTAAAASPGPWHANAESDEVLAVDDITVADGFALSGQQLRATTAHIARHDPARVLREVEAKRGVIEQYESIGTPPPGEIGPELSRAELGRVLRLLALPYADHPDYDEDWRP